MPPSRRALIRLRHLLPRVRGRRPQAGASSTILPPCTQGGSRGVLPSLASGWGTPSGSPCVQGESRTGAIDDGPRPVVRERVRAEGKGPNDRIYFGGSSPATKGLPIRPCQIVFCSGVRTARASSRAL